MQAAGGLVRAGIEFAAGMQGAHDDFQRRFLRKLGMRIDRNAAPVVHHAEIAVLVHGDVDAGGVAGHRLVHRIVEHFGEQVMQRALVGAADIHARTPAHRLEPLQHLDRGGVIVGLAGRAGVLGLFDFRRGFFAARELAVAAAVSRRRAAE